jgi:hypothetical protein
MQKKCVRQGVNIYMQFILIPCLDCHVEKEIRTSVEEKLLHARTNTHTHTSMSTLFFVWYVSVSIGLW